MTSIPSVKESNSNDTIKHNSSSSSRVPWHWGWSAVIAAITLITLAFRYALPIRDGDLWWHMLYGKYFLDNKTLIADHTIFSWTRTTNDTIYCTWLPDIFFYLLHKMAGLPGIFAFRYLCLLVLVLACFFYARKLKIVAHPLVWFICLLGVIMSYTAAFDKPEILSFVFMTLLVWNWWHIRNSGADVWKNCYYFPLIMLLWVNTHGGFVFGAVFLALISFGEVLNTWLSPQNALPSRIRKHLVIALLLVAITPLLNPYGYRYPLQLFSDLQPNPENISYNNKIAAYSAPFLSDDVFNFAICADLAICMLAVFYCRNLRKAEWSSLLVNLVFSFLYTRFMRTTFYWGPVFLFSSLDLLAGRPLIPLEGRYGRSANRLLPVLVTIAGVWLAGDSLYKLTLTPEKFLWMGFGICESNPVAEAQYIKKYYPKSRIGNTYDQGAYLLWELWPENKVFFDARHFPYRKWSDDYFSFAQGINVGEFVKRHPCDLWCVSLDNTTTNLWFMASPDWKLAYYGKSAAVFVRKEISLPTHTPIASPALSTLRSPSSAITALSFALNIQDWVTASQILARMQQEFTFFSQKSMVRKAEIFALGFHAYYQHDYKRAVKLFDSMYPDVMISNTTYAYSLIHLSAEAWEKKDGGLARTLNQKAWSLYPGYYINIYNAGAMNWYDWQSSILDTEDVSLSDPGEGGKIPHDLWKFQLRQFLDRAPNTSMIQAYRDSAQQMMDNSFVGRPTLMVPPPP